MFRRTDGLIELPADLAATVRARIGYSVSKSEVLALPGIVDHWFAVGMVDTAEYRLDTRRVWLYGAASGRWAVIMSFAPPGGPLDDDGDGRPPAARSAALLPRLWTIPRTDGEQTSATAGRDDAAGRIIRRGTRSLRPAGRSRSVGCSDAGSDQCGSRPGRRTVADAGADGRVLRRSSIFLRSPGRLLARSGGEPIEVFGEWTHRGFRPLSLLGTDATEPFSTAVVARAA